MNTDTIQMSLFDYFMEDEQFTIPEATALVKEQKKLQVNDESIRARIYEGLELGIFKRVARGVYNMSDLRDRKILEIEKSPKQPYKTKKLSDFTEKN